MLVLECTIPAGFSSTHVSVSLELRPQTTTQIKDIVNVLSFLSNSSVKHQMLDELLKIFWTSQENIFLGTPRWSRIWHILDNLTASISSIHRDLLKWNGCYKSILYIRCELYLVNTGQFLPHYISYVISMVLTKDIFLSLGVFTLFYTFHSLGKSDHRKGNSYCCLKLQRNFILV